MCGSWLNTIRAAVAPAQSSNASTSAARCSWPAVPSQQRALGGERRDQIAGTDHDQPGGRHPGLDQDDPRLVLDAAGCRHAGTQHERPPPAPAVVAGSAGRPRSGRRRPRPVPPVRPPGPSIRVNRATGARSASRSHSWAGMLATGCSSTSAWPPHDSPISAHILVRGWRWSPSPAPGRRRGQHGLAAATAQASGPGWPRMSPYCVPVASMATIPSPGTVENPLTSITRPKTARSRCAPLRARPPQHPARRTTSSGEVTPDAAVLFPGGRIERRSSWSTCNGTSAREEAWRSAGGRAGRPDQPLAGAGSPGRYGLSSPPGIGTSTPASTSPCLEPIRTTGTAGPGTAWPDTAGAEWHPDLRLPPGSMVVSKGQDRAAYQRIRGT